MVCLQGVDTDVLPYGSALSPRRSAPLRFCSLVHSCRGGTVAEASAKISKISGWRHDLADVFSPKGEHCRPQTLRNVQTDNDTGMLQDRICVAAKGKRLLRAQFSATAFHRPFSGIAHAPGRPSGPMVTIHGSQNSANPGPEISQIGASAFSRGYSHVFQAFSFRKWRNIGLLRGKHPRFCLESTEVWVQEVRCFWHIPALPSLLFPRSGGVCAAKTVQKSGGTAAPCTPICHIRLAEYTNPPRFPRWKGHCTLSSFLKVFTPFPPRIHARPPRVCFPVSPSIQPPLCPPACVQGVAWAQKHTFRTLSTRALHTVRTYYAP